jgi:hypothetical protein
MSKPKFIHLRYYREFPYPMPREIAPKALTISADDIDFAQEIERVLEEVKSLFKTEQPYPKGGVTIAQITDEEDRPYFGVSVCSQKDSFVKGLGRGLALVRAYEAQSKDVLFVCPECRLSPWIEDLMAEISTPE